MMHEDAAIQPAVSTFFESWLFQPLPASVKRAIAPKLEVCSFQPGELLNPAKGLPLAVHYVMQGQVRILGPVSHQSPTLEIVGKGAVIGWEALLRRVTTGSARAALSPQATDCQVTTLALPADEFEYLAFHYLSPVLAQQTSLLEIFDTLSQGLSSIGDRIPLVDLKQVAQYLQQEQLVTVQHWSKLQPNQPAAQLPSEQIWFLSGGEYLNYPTGTVVTASVQSQLKQLRPSQFPIRLIGIERNCLASILKNPSIANTISPTKSAVELKTSPPPSQLPPPSYSIWRSPTPDLLEDIIACFGMICDRLQVPYRPDSLRKLLAKQNIDRFEPFDLCLRIAQAIGLNAYILPFTPTSGGINRLPTPVLIQCSHIFAVLHDVTSTTAVLGSPRTGLLRLDVSELAAHLMPEPTKQSDRENSCRAIVIERLPSTPTKRFGFHWFLPMVVKQRGILVQVLLASIVIQLLGVANPLLVQQVIDNVIVSANAGAMTMFGTLMVIFALLEGVLTILRTYLLIGTTNRIDLHLGIEIVRHLLHLPLNFFEKRPVGELSSRLQELENIRQFMTDTAITTVMDVIFSLFYIGVMFLYSSRLTLCVLATIPVIILSMLVMSGIQQKMIRVKADQGAQVQSYLVEVLSGISSVKSQHIETLVEATWRDRYVRYLSSGFTTSTTNALFYSYSQFLNTLSSLLVLWIGAETVLKGELTLGGLIAFRILTGYVTGPLLRLARLWQRFQETSLSMDLLADIADSPAEAELSQTKVGLQLPEIVGRVQYHEVSFAFNPGKLQLSNVDLDIAPGTFVGIVGQSGSGKSTLMKLLPRLYLPQSGKISIDSYDVNRVDLNSLRSQVGIVSQDTILFQGTVRDNIALFSDLSDDAVIHAARIAAAHEFIMQLPEGYNTQVGERGSNLSGGQRQRIAIARTVIRNPRLLIFDEATSALDYETERQVCTNLMQHFHDRTCFFITHRLNTIARADWILFMQSGVIAEQGTHEELISRRQLYYCLYAQQSQEA